MNANQALPIRAPETTIHDPRKRRAILIAVCIALMAVIASVSGLNVAQPQLALAFDASQSTVLWIINIYTITLAALLLPLGALGDRIGRKPILLAGLIVFGIANAIAAANGAGPRSQALIRAAQESFVTGWQHAMWVGAGIMAMLLVYVVARGPRRAAVLA
ncbi:MAG: hypothetical protein QOH03_3190 [Kribbellaceae bacterium]|jgi:MFS family permease|nr:hypothetical protein [Kribbellaceae bacterium]